MTGDGGRAMCRAAVTAFLLSMLAKTVLVAFPVVTLLHAWRKRDRIARQDLARAAPLFAVSLCLGLLTLVFQHGRAIGWDRIPIGGAASRIATAGMAILFYLATILWPVKPAAQLSPLGCRSAAGVAVSRLGAGRRWPGLWRTPRRHRRWRADDAGRDAGGTVRSTIDQKRPLSPGTWSPPARVMSEANSRIVIASLMNLTEPSPRATLIPLGWNEYGSDAPSIP